MHLASNLLIAGLNGIDFQGQLRIPRGLYPRWRTREETIAVRVGAE
jgi:hypothetical protein